MANPGLLDLQVPRGADWDYLIGWADLAGALVDMSGRVLQAEVLRTTYTPAVPIGLAAGVGLVTLTFLSAVTETLPRRARWELRQALPGRQTTLLAGYLTVIGD